LRNISDTDWNKDNRMF